MFFFKTGFCKSQNSWSELCFAIVAVINTNQTIIRKIGKKTVVTNTHGSAVGVIILSVIIADFMTLSGSDLKNFYKGLLFLTLPILLASFVPILSTKIGMFFGICVSYVTFFGVLSLCGQIINIFYSSFS